MTPDDQLAAGGVDFFQARGFRAFGPTRAASKIEWSKVYAKAFMNRANIRTAPHLSFADYDDALAHARTRSLPFMVKKSGNALGKGAKPCFTVADAEVALREIMKEDKCGPEENDVVIEDFLPGTEISMHALCDAKSHMRFPPSQDYKRVNDGDKGPMTGSMGSIVPLTGVDEIFNLASETIVTPALTALANVSTPFRGVLYPGLMLGPDGIPSVLEFNARLGDSECQAYMRYMRSNLYSYLQACIDDTLHLQEPIVWNPGFVACVNLVSGGYPNDYKKGYPITGLEEAEKVQDVVVFHAGTRFGDDGIYYTNGGRVLNVTAWGSTLQIALNRAYEAISHINFQDMHFRRDIGCNAF